MRSWIITILNVVFFMGLSAQQWNWAKDIGKYYPEGKKPLVKTNSNGDLFTSGVYSGEVKFGNITFFADTIDYSSHGNYVACFASDGSAKWAKDIRGVNTYLTDISVDKNNNVYAYGFYANDFILEDTALNNSEGAFLIKYDASGNRLWLKTFADMNGNFTYAVCDENNNLLLAAASGNPKGVRVRKISGNDGSELWTKNFAVNITADLRLRGLQVNKANEIFVYGSFDGNDFNLDGTSYSFENIYTQGTFIAKLNTNGVVQDVDMIKGAILYELEFDAQNNLYLMGSYVKQIMIDDTTMQTEICDEFNCEEYFLSRLTAAGSVVWAKRMEDSYFQAAISVTLAGDIFYTGNFHSGITFNNVTLTETENRAALFIFKFNKNGVAQWGLKDGGGYLAGSQPFDIAVSENKDVYVNGSNHNFYAQTWFGDDTLPRNTSFKSRIFIAKTRDTQVATGIALMPISNDETIEVFPNPSNGQFVIRMDRIPAGASIRVYDVLGNCVSPSVPLTYNGQILDLRRELKGVYLLEISSKEMTSVSKIFID